MPHGFVEAFVGRLGKRQPAAGPNLPVVHAREAASLERPEGRRGESKQSLDLYDLPLAKDRFQGPQERHPSPLEAFVD